MYESMLPIYYGCYTFQAYVGNGNCRFHPRQTKSLQLLVFTPTDSTSLYSAAECVISSAEHRCVTASMAIFYCDSEKPSGQPRSGPDKMTSAVAGGLRRQEGRCYKRPAPGQHMEPTHHVCVIGVSEHEVEALREAGPSFGEVRSIERNAKNHGIRVLTYDSLGDAEAANQGLAGLLAPRLGRRVGVYFCELVPPKPLESLRCTSETADLAVPGLTLIREFVGIEEETALLKHFLRGDSARWTGPLSRRVQHYGKVFDYHTRHVDFDASAPPFPECLDAVLAEIRSRGLKPTGPDQMTLNEYKPGQGISPHVDTHSAFEDGLASLSLGSGCIMDMRHPDGSRVKNVYLPRRSLLVMEGAARYEWSHGIASRKTDMVEGVLKKRSTRVSLTFRRVRDPSVACACHFEASCDRRTPVPSATYLKVSS